MQVFPNPVRLAVLLAILLAVGICRGQERDQQRRSQRMSPTHADVTYGPHVRNVFDLYLAESQQPTPLVLYIHGGGFRAGDKRGINQSSLRAFLNQGYSVAALNYRLTNTAPAPAAYLDCGRALQFLRYHADKWNLDPSLVASTGGSAGAGTSLWLAFHDDLANPNSDDPVEKQSTRLTCVAVSNGQSSYDPRFAEKIGIPRPNFDRHPFFLPFYDIAENQIDTLEAYRKYEEMAPITYLSSDDPPALMDYGFPNVAVKSDSDLSLVVHHPLFGIALQQQMEALGLECVVQYADAATKRKIRHSGKEPVVSAAQFIKNHIESAKSAVADGVRK
jgi:acetyl esterase